MVSLKRHSRRKFIADLTLASGGIFLLPAVSGFTGKRSEYGGNKTTGLTIERQGTDLVYLARNGNPVMAFGCHFEHMLFADYNYEGWTEWAVAHGMNHCRARLYHAYYTDYSPFQRNTEGKFDLTKWDEAWWERFHKIMNHLQQNNIIVHLLIFPQGTGGTWWQGDGYYLPENNVHPETAFIRPEKSTAGFWQSLAKGENDLYEIQTAILWKLIKESVDYDNIYYDLCHEPFLHAMDEEALEDMKVFINETTNRFWNEYQKYRPDKIPVLGIDTDFTPPGEFRDWLYGHGRFNMMIQGKNHDPFYDTAAKAIELRQRFNKPYCPQESLDPPGVVHIPDIKHKNTLTYFESGQRNHIRKYVWRWFMAKSQVIDIYQKGLSQKDAVPERYNPWGHNLFEKDALVLREFWNHLSDYPSLSTKGSVVNSLAAINMALSSENEAILYCSSSPGVENETFESTKLEAAGLALTDGEYVLEFWHPRASGDKSNGVTIEVAAGSTTFQLPEFTDDIVVYLKGKK